APSLDPRLDLVPLPGEVRPHRLEAGGVLRGLRGGLPRDADHLLRGPPLLGRKRHLLRLGLGHRLRFGFRFGLRGGGRLRMRARVAYSSARWGGIDGMLAMWRQRAERASRSRGSFGGPNRRSNRNRWSTSASPSLRRACPSPSRSPSTIAIAAVAGDRAAGGCHSRSAPGS